MDTPRTVLVVGVGLIGGSLGLALQNTGVLEVYGADIDSHALGTAFGRGAVTAAVDDWRHEARVADFIIFCTPPAHIAANIRTACGLAKPGAVVTDMGSVKGQIAHAAGDASNYVGSHPMAGTEHGGIQHARADLFDRAHWAVCPTPFSSQHAINAVHALAELVHARPLTVAPGLHDELLAVTSHLPHALAAALVHMANAKRADFPDLPRLSAGSFRDASRVALSSPALWRDVCLANADAVRAALSAFGAELAALDAALASSDAAAVEDFFASAQAQKQHWDMD